ncbi:helix-turn-helix domain-containing protein [Tenacibaculum sp. 190524A05c]|uniref:HemN C-terminal domain-containing protein n=1 Tax=Tenacibaculum platacis TaxID=3137852 RepID=A0ABM9NVR9_9FLAO
MKFFSEDIEFVKELFDSKQVNLYHFHEKYLLSPAQLARTIKKFREEGIIELNDDKISLTTKGEKWIICSRKKLFLNERNKYWKEVPLEMKQESIMINEFYKPNRNKLDTELFKNIEGGK